MAKRVSLLPQSKEAGPAEKGVLEGQILCEGRMVGVKIDKILSQHRRDFHAVYICEGCNAKVKRSGYDDRNFHDNAIPNWKCAKCGKSRNNMGIQQEPTPTKYHPWEIV